MFYAAAELIPCWVSPYSSNAAEGKDSEDKEVASDQEDEVTDEEERNDLVLYSDKSDKDDVNDLDDEDFDKASTPPLIL